MSNINNIILETLSNNQNTTPWNIFNLNSNYNPHLQVRPLSTEYNNYKIQQQNLAKNPNKQPINQRTARFINNYKPIKLN